MRVNEDKFNMLKGIFEEQRALTDDEMKAYKDMLHRKEKDMVVDKLEIKIEPKIVVSKETAETCLKIVEMWVNAERNRGIEEVFIDEYTAKFLLKGE